MIDLKRSFNYKKINVEIVPYSRESLAKVLSNQYTPSEVISSKFHYIYLCEYLEHADMHVQTIVVEDKYISKDFLHDFASYYALCFEEYPKFCKRVHFFSNTFSLEEFEKVLLHDKEEENEFWKHYLGFVVVKPIPVTILGYSVLKTYTEGEDFNERNFWGVRDYKVHFFGNEISLKSLAFQEQDSVLSACATTAIWMMLNKAAADFHTILKSPSQITKDADTVSSDGSRLFPNKGLNLLQICNAILNSGLVSEIKNADFMLLDNGVEKYYVSNQYLKKILNAYSPIGIPIILVIKVPNGASYGLHAITVSGFKQTPPNNITPNTSTSWLSDNIEKFYAHDDQWGPFARIDFRNDCELGTPWTIFHPNQNPTYTTNIVVPIYPKIRISYEDIEVIVLGLDSILTLFFDNMIVSDLVWDIKIDYSEHYKSQIKKSANLSEQYKISHLTKSLPKYIWIASCYIEKYKILEFTFDATNVGNGMIGIDLISYMPSEINRGIKENLVIYKDQYKNLFRHTASTIYYEFLINKLTEWS